VKCNSVESPIASSAAGKGFALWVGSGVYDSRKVILRQFWLHPETDFQTSEEF